MVTDGGHSHHHIVWEIFGCSIAFYLQARDLSQLAAVNKIFASLSVRNDLWINHLSRDFMFQDKQDNRSEGYYRSHYLALLEDYILEHNLLTGGH
jgi:hypothetical protein